MSRFEIVPFQTLSGADNMKLDEELLDKSIKDVSDKFFFRLYGWQPACISLGCNQKSDFLDYELLEKHNIDTVTRLTGGRALLHDKELTYSVVCPVQMLENGQRVIASYKELSEILILAFEELGVSLSLGGESVHTSHDYCMLVSTGADLNYCGKKLIGSAQCRKRGYILQHGSILYDYDKSLLEDIFKEPVCGDSVTTVKEVIPELSFESFVESFQDAIIKVLSLKWS